MENNKSSMGLKIGLGIALVLFLATGFYTMNLYKTSNETQKELNQEKHYKITRRDDGSWLCDGLTPIDEIED
ncbi:MAG: hypothetical protein B7Z06_04880, partial [Flavobacteriales bacterium 32-35-8]